MRAGSVMGVTLALTLLRYALAVVGAGVATVGIFFFMHRLIAMGDAEIKEAVKGRVIDFVRVKREPTVEEKQRELPDKPPDTDQPPPPELDMSAPDVTAETTALAINAPKADIAVDLQGPTLGAAPSGDADAAPLVRVEPDYPRKAAEQGIEGWVVLRFDIGTAGQVQNAKVVKAQPPRVFDKSALRAVKRWKYRPTIVKGKAIVKPGVKVKLSFNL